MFVCTIILSYDYEITENEKAKKKTQVSRIEVLYVYLYFDYIFSW